MYGWIGDLGVIVLYVFKCCNLIKVVIVIYYVINESRV